MKISVNKDQLTVHVTVENDQDLIDAEKIKMLMSHPDWALLANAFLNVREAYITSITNVTASELNLRMAPLKAGALKGFDRAVTIPEEIIKSAEIYRAARLAKLNEEEKHNADETDGPQYDLGD